MKQPSAGASWQLAGCANFAHLRDLRQCGLAKDSRRPILSHDTPGDTEARPVTVDSLMFRFEDSKSSVQVICDGVVVETV
jgi:hypothetical protein